MSRALTFWTDETIQMIRDNFIAATVPTWVCRTKGPVGEFLRSAEIHKHWVTSSGYMNCVSASGQLLGGKPSPEVLNEFAQLPEEERRPGAIKVPELQPSEKVIPSPPEGGLVLRVHARFLSRDKDGRLRPAQTTDFPLMRDKPRVQRLWRRFLEPNTEYMWLTQEERQSLVPTEPAVGQKLTVRPLIAERMARFHLNPKRAMTSEGGIVDEDSVRSARLELTVREVSPQCIRMELDGFIHWGSDFDPSRATSPNGPLALGYSTPIEGRLEYNRTKKAFSRFDIVAPGDVWGRWGDANGKSMPVERPGRRPFGFAFELATGETPTDRIPPGGNSHYIEDDTGYFASSE